MNDPHKTDQAPSVALLDRAGRDLVVQMEAGVLRQNGCRLTDEWWADADAYVDGAITLDQWRLRNGSRAASNEDFENLFTSPRQEKP